MGERQVLVRAAAGILCGIAILSQANADPLPTQIGQCSRTTISRIGTRLDGVAGSGSALRFANSGYQVSYETVPQVSRSRIGDPVRVCLVSIPQDCPPGDSRGRVYHITNLRTEESWQLPDSPHSCGGA